MIQFVRSGGFAGLRLARDFDTSALPAEQAQMLEHLVDAAGFFDLPDAVAATKPVPDSFEYRITVTSSEATRAIVVTDTTMPDKLRPLADYLSRLAKLGKDPGQSGKG